MAEWSPDWFSIATGAIVGAATRFIKVQGQDRRSDSAQVFEQQRLLIRSLSKRITKLESDLNGLGERHDKTMKELQESHIHCQMENTRLTERISQLEDENSNQAERITQLESEVAGLMKKGA